MIDLSEESFEENIETCARYLERMSKMGMTLEIELGCTGGEEDGNDNTGLDNSACTPNPKTSPTPTKPLMAISPRPPLPRPLAMCTASTSRATFNSNPRFCATGAYVAELTGKTLNFVFHGGSGSSAEEIRESIGYGL